LRFTSRRDLVAAVTVVAVTAGTAVVAVGCRQNDDPDGARALYAEVTAGEGFRSWPRAPGYPGRTPSFTAHSSEVEIFVSPSLSDALDGPEQVREWPVGAIVVKEGFRDGERRLVAMMQKRQDGWYWAETDGEGEPLYSGKPAVCIDCHERRATYSDWVYSFELPR
jgi:hypothetical protein